jgi:hypothetical protein
VSQWYSARCLYRRDHTYHERLTLWQAPTFEVAAELAEADARQFAAAHGWDYLDYVALYEITIQSDAPGQGDEVYSLYRFTDLGPRTYQQRFLPAPCTPAPVPPAGGRATFRPHAWYTVRCLFQGIGARAEQFEERMTLWHARSPARAAALARAEGRDYANDLGLRLIGCFGVVQLRGQEHGHGIELFAACRDSPLDVDDYLNRFLDTGEERQRDLETGE